MIYFIKETGSQAIKIGYSKKPTKRLGGLQTANPHKLVMLGIIPGTEQDESLLHAQFSQYRLAGEWFKGEIIEAVFTIISAKKEQARQIRRRTMTDSNDNADPNLALDDKGTTDNDSGISGISRVRGLRMKSFSLKLTENPQEARGIKVVSCGAEIKYLLVFERDFTVDETGQKELAELRQGLFRQDRGLKHRFYDEDNALIPFCVGNQSQEFGAYHIVGGQEAITGVEGEAIRVLVVFEATLYSNQGATKIKDVFTGQNYTAEHPLKKAKRMVVSLR